MPAVMPAGSAAVISFMASRTRPITSREFAPGSTQTPMKVAVCPLKRTSSS